MKISYQRDMKHNYLIVESEEIEGNHYERKIMEENHIEGLLRLTVRYLDGCPQFYYEITSKQPLGRLLENRMLSGEELRTLIVGIAKVLNRMERFLLREGSILLEPDYIFVDPESFRVWLCLIPALNREFTESYGKLLEYFLGKVDHQDKESVVIAYGLYQETRKENYGIEDILKILYQERDKGVYLGGVKAETASFPEEKGTASFPVLLQKESEKKEEKKGIWETLGAVVRGKGKEITAKEPVTLAWKELFAEESGQVERERLVENTESRNVYKTEVPQDTVLLYERPQGEQIRALHPLDGDGDLISISYYPFVIGKQENMVDYCLQRDTVSRLHLRIDRCEEEYRITDLNSTNGTMIGGKLLGNNETVTIRLGDEMQIARHRYRFE